MSSLGTKIRKLRELKNYKQDYMADKLGISQSAYSKIEKDETEISHDRLEQIAKALDVSVHDILSFDEKVFFNIVNQGHYSGGYIVTQNNQTSENEKRLYEDKAKLMEGMIEMLKKENESLKSEIEKLKSGKQ